MQRFPQKQTLTILLPFTVAIVACLSITGCETIADTDAWPGQLPVTQDASASWDVIFLHEKPIGFATTTVTRESSPRGPAAKWEQVTQIDVMRFGQTMRQTISATSRELLDGGLIDGQWNVAGSGSEQRGTVEANGTLLAIQPEGAATISRDWHPTHGGFFAVEQSLRSQPLASGESRSVTGLLPLLNQIAKFKLEAKSKEIVELLNGSRELLRIENEFALSGAAKMHVTLWADSAGVVHKQTFRELNQTMIRTDEHTAKSAADGQMDLGELATVRLKHNLNTPPDLHNAQSATFRIRRKGSNDAELNLIQDAWQTVSRNAGGGLDVTVARADATSRPAKKFAVAADDPLRQIALRSSQLIDHEDSQVRTLLEQAIGKTEASADSPKAQWETACRLERFARDHIQRKDFSQLLLSASEVAAGQCGDCTEHAVLLAALCRAANIPSQVAIGIVHVPREDGFVFHMWTEALINDRWIPLDATLGRGGIGAGHIKAHATCLQDNAGLSDFLPIAQLVGQIEIELVEVTQNR